MGLISAGIAAFFEPGQGSLEVFLRAISGELGFYASRAFSEADTGRLPLQPVIDSIFTSAADRMQRISVSRLCGAVRQAFMGQKPVQND
jgi:hypothetical protein